MFKNAGWDEVGIFDFTQHCSFSLTQGNIMERIVFRSGIKTYLRPITVDDAPILVRWLNDPEITQYLLRRTPMTEIAERAWIEKLATSNSDFVFAIMTREDDKHIGNIGLHDVNYLNRTAVTGTLIGNKAFWGKGYGTDAKMLLLDFAFSALDLHAILSKVLDTNGRSLAYADKCGYKEVGRIPKWIHMQDGGRADEVNLVVTRETWLPLWEEYKKRRGG